ncbi:MAG: hypothetical protein KBT20_11615 [Bacteroidales bacterium]|nr:hypothetical protein [Candidatus Liminaster caballi]
MNKEFDFEKVYDEIRDIDANSRVIRTWTEDFEDEDTHEVVTIERMEVVRVREYNAVNAARIAELEKSIFLHINDLTDDQLRTMYYRNLQLAYLLEAMKRQLDWATEIDHDDINNVTYTITSEHPESLDAIETLIDDVCQKEGIPENVADGLPMCVPYSTLMQVLVSENRFVGLVETKERTANALVLHCECPDISIHALAEALTEHFSVKVEVSM